MVPWTSSLWLRDKMLFIMCDKHEHDWSKQFRVALGLMSAHVSSSANFWTSPYLETPLYPLPWQPPPVRPAETELLQPQKCMTTFILWHLQQ